MKRRMDQAYTTSDAQTMVEWGGAFQVYLEMDPGHGQRRPWTRIVLEAASNVGEENRDALFQKMLEGAPGGSPGRTT